MIYDIIYALMAQEGREAALFGDGAPLAHEAFERSLAGAAFPELWFELPLAGDPWFDVTRAGAAGSTFAASLRFGAPSEASSGSSFDPNGAAGELMKLLESWGLADERWRLLAGTMFAKRMARQGRQGLLYAYPAFIKLRWRNGEPVDAKTYLIAGCSRLQAGLASVRGVR